MAVDSRLSGFHRLSVAGRRSALVDQGALDPMDTHLLDTGGLDPEAADLMGENVLGVLAFPISVATNFTINSRDVIVPMAIEEPSVVAAASNAARLARPAGGFTAQADPAIMAGQVELRGLADPDRAAAALFASADLIMDAARTGAPDIEVHGGGIRGIDVRHVTLRTTERILVVHLLVDCMDAMGANTVNSMAEAAAPVISRISGGLSGLRILTNLADRRLARASCRVTLAALETYRGAAGADPASVRDGVVAAWELAEADPYRAATHNKGVMNGIDAVALATGNDFRALEAGAHAWASRQGRYTSLTTWAADGAGDLVGTVEMPAAVGILGGMTRYHPLCARALGMMGVTRASDLAGIMLSVGLATNLAALLALTTEGIQQGHMRLQGRRK